MESQLHRILKQSKTKIHQLKMLKQTMTRQQKYEIHFFHLIDPILLLRRHYIRNYLLKKCYSKGEFEYYGKKRKKIVLMFKRNKPSKLTSEICSELLVMPSLMDSSQMKLLKKTNCTG